MINAKVKEFLDIKGLGDRLTEHSETIDTVEHAAQQIGCTEPETQGWCDVCKGWEEEE